MSDQLVTEWEAQRLAELDVLDDGEVVCDVEEAWSRTGWGRGSLGAIVLTDRRLLFSTTSAFRRRTRIDAIALKTIDAIEVIESMWADRGAFRVSHTDRGARKSMEFVRIPGGADRAVQLVRATERQCELLRRAANGLQSGREGV